MASEEASYFHSGTRRGDIEPTQLRALSSSVQRKMRDRFDQAILAGYLSSVARHTDQRLQPYLQALAPQVLLSSTSSAPRNVNGPSSGHPTFLDDDAAPPPEGDDECNEDWPQILDQTQKNELFTAYLDGTRLAFGPTCAVCGRRTYTRDLLFTPRDLTCERVPITDLPLNLLEIVDPHVRARADPWFVFGHPAVDGLALDRRGVHIKESEAPELDICNECMDDLGKTSPRLPALSLANDNIRGFLPEWLRDITWLEERLCAPYLSSAFIVRLFDFSGNQGPREDDSRPRIMRGHACAFPLNTISISETLPWSWDRMGPLVTCLVIGPRKSRPTDLKYIFKVRRAKIAAFLTFLAENFKDYPEIRIDHHALAQLPEDGVPQGLMERIVYEYTEDNAQQFDQETAGLEPHHALLDLDPAAVENGIAYVERNGLLDVHGTGVPASMRTASAFATATGGERHDITVHHGSRFISDYNNPDLFPRMFPLLFPWGTGGFELRRKSPLPFNRQAAYLLDLDDASFRRHWSYIFVVANIKQRRTIHIGSKLACKARDHGRVSRLLKDLSTETVERVSQHLQLGGNKRSLSAEERRVCTLLDKCQLLSTQVPGSRAMMNRARADIRSYIGEFGIFHLFLTLNPHPEYAASFQVFFGDQTIDLSLPAPLKTALSKRMAQVADDPVAAADYFHFQIAATFQYLFGWDVRKGKSSPEGGILGRLAAYFMTREHTNRGQLHGHILIWLKGGLNPRALRTKLAADDAFRDRYIAWLDDTVYHHLPPKNENCLSQTESGEPAVNQQTSTDEEFGAQSSSAAPGHSARERMPPNPSHDDFALRFDEDHRLLGEQLQRHVCRKTCYKGGRKDCRFHYPHDLQEETRFDAATSSITLRVKDPTINWHNPLILVATRHNHDLKAVQSGLSSVAAAAYITSYATKSEETPASQVAMIHKVFQRMDEYDDYHTDLKTLLSRCVMQFGRERQVHAQQVATYVRDLGDVWQSHQTIPMLSGSMMVRVFRLYGPARSTEVAELASSEPAADGEDGTRAHERGEEPQAQAQDGDGAADEAAANATDDDSEDEDGTVELMPLSSGGKAHQVDCYLYRGDTLRNLCFYDFVKYCSLVPKAKRHVPTHHALHEDHPNASTHAHRYTPNQSRGLPRAIFSYIPRSDGTPSHGDQFCAATLLHFKPFSITCPLKAPDETYEEAYASTQLSARLQKIVENWDALAECDDAKDKEQLQRRKREAMAASGHDAETGVVRLSGDDDDDIEVRAEALAAANNRQDDEAVLFLKALTASGWFRARESAHPTLPALALNTNCPPFSTSRRRQWNKEQSEIERNISGDRSVPKASSGVLAYDLSLDVDMGAPSAEREEGGAMDDQAAEQERRQPVEVEPTAERRTLSTTPAHVLIDQLIAERNLNKAQALTFKIVARHFFQDLYGVGQPPLRLLMHGEAGTGKTVVVRLFRELLDRYGKGNEIMFVAPTGKAACAIGGVTQHSAFALAIRKRKRDQSNEDAERQPDAASAKRLRYLQNTFANIKWIFFDEVSMTSCEVLSEIDQALRLGTQKPDEFFGGVNVVFAGDLCQLPPVAAAPLYTVKQTKRRDIERRAEVELGRAAWLQVTRVVDFTEQMRMQDADMAAALARLRVRQCTEADAELFNRNVLRGPCAAAFDAIALARTNETVRLLNARKAESQATSTSKELFHSYALDTASPSLALVTRKQLLTYNGSTANRGAWGKVPLYMGMPVVYRGPNDCVPLGVTNGATAIVRGWDLLEDPFGYTVPRGVVLEFDDSASWSLTGLEAGCLPVDPLSCTFKFTGAQQQQNSIRVSRKQLPIRPAFAMTIHSAQGITTKSGIIIDLRDGGFEAYVAASRATKREHVFLVEPVTASLLNRHALPEDLSNELERLEKLSRHTRLLHDNATWRLDAMLKRPADPDSLDAERPFKRPSGPDRST